ncbi:MAG TPA: biotin/lipoyl-containing protein [Gaiellaceae bacterium]|nr:biotin/lipoyl-containing protein [Gaiellaceae bacterium]
MLEIVLTREDANSESALLAEWLADDRTAVRKGRAVCVVETSKASVEIEAPGDGILVQLVGEGVEVELGTTIAVVATSEAEAAHAAEAKAPPPAPVDESQRTVTRKAAALAAEHGIDPATIEKAGFVTEADVEAAIRARDPERLQLDPVLAGISTENVTLPETFSLDESVGALDSAFLAELRADPAAFGELSSEERCERYRAAGAVIGEGVVLGRGTVLVAPRLVLGDGVRIEDGGRVTCAEVFAAGPLTRFGHSLQLSCRRAFVGAGVYAGVRLVIGGGGHRDPWATFVMGDEVYLGDEAFVNVARPVLIGAEAFVTMRSILVTHNIGHSPLEGFENHFAGIVVEDRAQVGLGSVVYAGCRIGREAIVVSGSYVVSDVPAGMLAAGVPARVAGPARRDVPRSRQVELVRRWLHELHETLVLWGVPVERLEGGDGLEVGGDRGAGRVLFVESLRGGVEPGTGETVVLTLDARDGETVPGVVVFDLLARQAYGHDGGVLADSVREFCRKRGVRFKPGPWRYGGGLF